MHFCAPFSDDLSRTLVAPKAKFSEVEKTHDIGIDFASGSSNYLLG